MSAFKARVAGKAGGYEVMSVSIDEEYLRYFDRVLVEISAADDRLPHPRNPDRTLLRSAAAQVILATFIAGREAEGGSAEGEMGIESAMTGDLVNVLLDGLVRRMDPRRRHRLVTVDLLLAPKAVSLLDDQLRRLAADFMAEEREWYAHDGFSDLRASFVEASIVAWLLLHELVAEEAVPARHTFALLDVQRSAPRRRRRLRTA